MNKEINCTEVCEGEFMYCENCRHFKKIIMEENINKAIEFIKLQQIHGCIAGSCLLEIFNDDTQDVDVFCYTKSSFIKLYYTLKFNPMFLILDPVYQLSSDNLEEDIDTPFRKRGIVSIKFMFNTCVPVNIVWKSGADNIYGVLSSFDMNIISKGYDILTKETMDLTKGGAETKIATWNIYNPKFYKSNLWALNSILRQFLRVIKYHKRGYNVDLVVTHYIEIIDAIQSMQNIYKSVKFEEILQLNKKNTKIIRAILVRWLETHTITDKELELLDLKIKELS